MRVTGQVLGQQADFLDHALDLCHSILLILVKMEVVEAFGNDVLNGGALVQGSGRILENHLDLADNFAVRFSGKRTGDAFALIENLTSGAGIDTNDGTANGGLAGSGLADEGESFTLVDVEADVVDCLERTLASTEDNIQIFNRKQYFFI